MPIKGEDWLCCERWKFRIEISLVLSLHKLNNYVHTIGKKWKLRIEISLVLSVHKLNDYVQYNRQKMEVEN
jgi:hypothetical protein